jgi:hypothetical protein
MEWVLPQWDLRNRKCGLNLKAEHFKALTTGYVPLAVT